MLLRTFSGLKGRMLLSIGSTVCAGLVLIAVVVALQVSKAARQEAFELARRQAELTGRETGATINEGMAVARSLADALGGLSASGAPSRSVGDAILRNAVATNPELLGVWTVWEPNAFDGKDAEFVNKPGHDATGRYVPYWNRATGTIETTIQRSDRGFVLSEKVASRLETMLDKARQVDEHVGQITTASNEQSLGINQINVALTQMDKITQDTAAQAEETASAAEELSAQAEVLKETVGRLLVLVEGSTGTLATAHEGTDRPTFSHDQHGASHNRHHFSVPTRARKAPRVNGTRAMEEVS